VGKSGWVSLYGARCLSINKEPPMRREDLTGTWAMEREAEWPSKRREEIAQQAYEYGLDSADSIRDRSISLFDRGFESFYSGERFMGAPFDELYHKLFFFS